MGKVGLLKVSLQDVENSQELGALAPLVEDAGLVPSPHKALSNSNFK